MSASPSAPSLTVRMAKGASWVVAWRMCTRLLGMVNTVVLVRLLVPADFGLVALATSLAQSLDSLLSVGVNDALIREEKPDADLYNTGFTMNLLRYCLMSACILAGAVPAGAFFGDPRLTQILFAIAGMVMISAFENIGIVEFRRNIAFEKEFRLQLLPRLGGIVASIAFALVFKNFWALVAGTAVNRGIRLIMTYWMHPFRPWITLTSWRRIIGFSFWAWAGAIVMMFKDRMDAIVIGRVMGPAQVGVYSVGQEMGALASTELLEPIAAALFSGLSVARREGGDISQGYLKGISAALMMALPVGVGISLVASPLVALLFGPKWSAAIPLVQVFALVGVTRAITYFSTVLLMTQGRLNFQVRIVLAGSAVRFILLLALIRPLGLMGALAAMAIGALVEETLFVATTFRMFELSPRALLKATWRSAVATAVMAGVVFWEGVGWASASGDVSHLVTDLATASITGAVTYCAALIALWWLCGRPNAAETVFLGIVRDTWRHTAGSLFRRPA